MTDMDLPPFNLEAEQGVLGSIALDNAAFSVVSPILKADHFYRGSHQIVYKAFCDLYAKHSVTDTPVDTVMLENYLRTRGELESAGGLDFIIQIPAFAPHSANARYYAQIVIEKSIARDLIEYHNEGLRKAYSQQVCAEELVGNAQTNLLTVIERACGPTETKSISELVADAAARFVDRQNGLNAGIMSGLMDLDKMTAGFRPGELIIIAARPSMGKTALIAQIILELALAKSEPVPVFFASLEMTPEAVMDRFVISRARIDGNLFRIGSKQITSQENARINQAYFDIAGAPIRIERPRDQTVESIIVAARRMKAKQGLGLIAVDYLQLVSEATTKRGSGDNRQEHIAKVSRSLKTAALDLNVPVIALSQLNRGVEVREDRRPRMSDIRESGAIENDADLILMPYRPDYYDPNNQPGVVELIVAKQRNGATGSVKCIFIKDITRFENSSLPSQQGVEY